MAEEIKEQVNQETEEQRLMICPCCGKPTMPVPAVVQGDVKEAFLASLLSGVEYKHTYRLFNGKLQITVRDLPNDIRDLMIRAANKAILEKDEEKQRQLNMAVARLSKLAPIVDIFIDLGEEEKPKSYNIQALVYNSLNGLIAANGIEQYKQINKNLIDAIQVSAVPSVVIQRVLDTHTKQMAVLLQSGFDETFSMGIVHAS